MSLQMISDNIELFLNNKYVSAIMAIVLIVYSGVVAPKLPMSITRYLHNDLVRVVAFFAIAFLATKNTVVALVAAIAVIATFQVVNSHRLGLAEHMTVATNNTKTTNTAQPPQPTASTTQSNHDTNNKTQTNGPTTAPMPHNTGVPDNFIIQVNDDAGNMNHELSCHWK